MSVQYARPGSGNLPVSTPEEMVAQARQGIAGGSDPQVLLAVAIAWRDKWARLVEEQENGAVLDGRASMYTGETYAEARDRWEAYRVLLVDELRGTHGLA